MEQTTVFNNSPLNQARIFELAGCRWLHVVDLDGALGGTPKNTSEVEQILRNVSIPIELGGGIRDRKTVDMWLEKGISRVILGTVAAHNQKFVDEICRAYPNNIAVGIDARKGMVATDGWSKTTRITALDLAKRFEDTGVAAIIHTDIDRDGVMAGPNIQQTLTLANAISTPVIASGGVSSMDDLKKLKSSGEGIIEGVICGRAIYDGLIDPAAATSFLLRENNRC